MKRLMLGIGAVLYLAACWAPQFWTGTADAQEKPKEPAVLEEVRARRLVLVDEEGVERAVLELSEESDPNSPAPQIVARLRMESPGAERSVELSTGANVPYLKLRRVHDEWGSAFEASANGMSVKAKSGPTVKVVGGMSGGVSVVDMVEGGYHGTGLKLKGVTIERFATGRGVSGEPDQSVSVVSGGLVVQRNGRTRAQIGTVETVNKRTGAETTQDGAFVSYDAEGNVLWMEPK